jgi:hypothetical protein
MSFQHMLRCNNLHQAFYDLVSYKKPYIKTYINGGFAFIPVRNHREIAKKLRFAIQRIIYTVINPNNSLSEQIEARKLAYDTLD